LASGFRRFFSWGVRSERFFANSLMVRREGFPEEAQRPMIFLQFIPALRGAKQQASIASEEVLDFSGTSSWLLHSGEMTAVFPSPSSVGCLRMFFLLSNEAARLFLLGTQHSLLAPRLDVAQISHPTGSAISRDRLLAFRHTIAPGCDSAVSLERARRPATRAGCAPDHLPEMPPVMKRSSSA
jgi:hypothetical protein